MVQIFVVVNHDIEVKIFDPHKEMYYVLTLFKNEHRNRVDYSQEERH